jgi:hypothetical protein
MRLFPSSGPPRRTADRDRARAGDRGVTLQVRRVRSLVEALMFDIAAWLAGVTSPVTPELCPDYAFNELRRLPVPRDRMAHYVGEGLLASWGEVLDRWVGHGLRLQPHFGQRLGLLVDGVGGTGPVKATFRFSNQSIILVGGRRQYCSGDWQMTVVISPNLKRIESVVLRPVAEGQRS